jgi:hypothetical protein
MNLTSKTSGDAPIVLFPDQKAWTAWLDKKHLSSPGLWLQLAKKGSYREALDLAQCYGSIDRSVDPFQVDCHQPPLSDGHLHSTIYTLLTFGTPRQSSTPPPAFRAARAKLSGRDTGRTFAGRAKNPLRPGRDLASSLAIPRPNYFPARRA